MSSKESHHDKNLRSGSRVVPSMSYEGSTPLVTGDVESSKRQNSPRTKQRPKSVNTSFNKKTASKEIKPSFTADVNNIVEEETGSYLTSFISSFSYLADALDGTLITNGEPSSPSPSSTSDHPDCSPVEVTSLDLAVPSGKKVRCTSCGMKLNASDTPSHVCNLSELFSRCSHCGENVPVMEASLHWCDGAIDGKRLEPPSPTSPLVTSITSASTSAVNTAILTMGSALDTASEAATYSQAMGNAAFVVATCSSSNMSKAASHVASDGAARVVSLAKNVATSWLLRLGYDLAAAPQFLPGHEVEFESELMKGKVFVALKRDVNLDKQTHSSFFNGKGRTVQLQWCVTLKRKLRGPLFIGFESNQSRQTGNLPRGTMQSCLISALSMFHAKKDLHLHLPSSSKPINVDNDWGLGVVGNKALVSFFETAKGEVPPPLNRPLESNMKCINYEDMHVGTSYSFCWYTQYVEFTDMTLVNLPMVGRYGLPFNAVRCVLYEHSPVKREDSIPSSMSSADSLLNPPGSVRMINKKAKARAGCDKQSSLIGDFLVGRMVVVLEVGTANDGTPRARVRGPGTLKNVQAGASASFTGDSQNTDIDSDEVKEGKKRKSKAAVVELDAWISASLLDNPNPPDKNTAIGNSDDRTYAFSCIFATR